MSEQTPTRKPESPLLNLALNVIIPVIILTKFSKAEYLGVTYGLVVALAFPLGYGIYDYVTRGQKINVLSILGLVSVLITGTIGLLKLDPAWVAVKEATIPFLIGLAVVISMWTRFPLVRKLLYNKQIIDVEKVDAALESFGNKARFEEVLKTASWMIAGSFLVSSILNYALAKYLVKSPAGTEAFNEELGQMTFWSFPVIAVPSTLILVLALLYVAKQLKRLANLEMEEIIRNQG